MIDLFLLIIKIKFFWIFFNNERLFLIYLSEFYNDVLLVLVDIDE